LRFNSLWYCSSHFWKIYFINQFFLILKKKSIAHHFFYFWIKMCKLPKLSLSWSRIKSNRLFSLSYIFIFKKIEVFWSSLASSKNLKNGYSILKKLIRVGKWVILNQDEKLSRASQKNQDSFLIFNLAYFFIKFFLISGIPLKKYFPIYKRQKKSLKKNEK
jgi:hypothetical protein